mmetsp:Transcript_10135/g.35439  ORF Transcript_10135/g.35439 Transcript_10135/m.35439 type:complete len:359 (+) Transcript_10135:388-1464(+)
MRSAMPAEVSEKLETQASSTARLCAGHRRPSVMHGVPLCCELLRRRRKRSTRSKKSCRRVRRNGDAAIGARGLRPQPTDEAVAMKGVAARECTHLLVRSAIPVLVQLTSALFRQRFEADRARLQRGRPYRIARGGPTELPCALPRGLQDAVRLLSPGREGWRILLAGPLHGQIHGLHRRRDPGRGLEPHVALLAAALHLDAPLVAAAAAAGTAPATAAAAARALASGAPAIERVCRRQSSRNPDRRRHQPSLTQQIVQTILLTQLPRAPPRGLHRGLAHATGLRLAAEAIDLRGVVALHHRGQEPRLTQLHGALPGGSNDALTDATSLRVLALSLDGVGVASAHGGRQQRGLAQLPHA